jgi:hypothetical protein
VLGLIEAAWESLAISYAAQELVPQHLREVRRRRDELVRKAMVAVKDRLDKEINYWDLQSGGTDGAGGGTEMKLRVEKASKEDIYRDIVRIPEQYRTSADGNTIPEGSVCKITTPEGKKAYAIVRGLGDETEPVVKIDERQRNMLRLRPGEEVELRLQKVGFVGEWLWAHSASDPSYRVVARLALYSLCLAVLGLLFGILSLLVD